MSDPLAHPRILPLVETLRPVWADLGVVPDREIARRVELRPGQVTRVRELACIPPATADLPNFERRTRNLRRRTELFAELSDRELAWQCGVRASVVRLFRAMHGLPTRDEAGDGTAAPPDPPFEPWMRLVGLVKDSHLARLARQDYSLVQVVRAVHLGLPRVRGAGWTHLPPWTHAETESADDLATALGRASGRPELRAVKATDPRFGHWFRSVGSRAADLAEAVAGYADLDVRPMARKVYQLQAVLARFDACATMGLDEEMRSLAEASTSADRAAAVVGRFGLDGEPPRSLETLGGHVDLSPNHFRRLAQRFERSLGVQPWVPTFDRFLASIDGGPADGAALTAAARAHGSQGTWPAEVVASAARLLGRSVTLVRTAPLRHGPFTMETALLDLPEVAELAAAAARSLGSARLAIRVAGGTWSAGEVGEDLAAELRGLSVGADAIALARRAVVAGAAGVYVVAERPGACIEAWAPDGRAVRLGPAEPLDEPIWFRGAPEPGQR